MWWMEWSALHLSPPLSTHTTQSSCKLKKTLLMMKRQSRKIEREMKKEMSKVGKRAPQWWQQQFTSLLSPVDEDDVATNNSFVVILLISYTFIRLPVIILRKYIVSQKSKVESLVMIRLITISFMSLEPSSSSLLLLLTERDANQEKKTRWILFLFSYQEI